MPEAYNGAILWVTGDGSWTSIIRQLDGSVLRSTRGIGSQPFVLRLLESREPWRFGVRRDNTMHETWPAPDPLGRLTTGV
jgi:hypothetical protein